MNANLPFGRNAARNMLNPLVSCCRGGDRQESRRAYAHLEPARFAPRSKRGNAILRAEPPAGGGDKSGRPAYDT